jgi:hypothetical protein
MYLESLDSALPRSAESGRVMISTGSTEQTPDLNSIQGSERQVRELSGLSFDEFWREADAESLDLRKEELARALLSIGVKYNYGLPAGVQATRSQAGAFWRALELRDLALARADGSLRGLLARPSRIDVLVIGDWAIAPLTDTDAVTFGRSARIAIGPARQS